jgi:DNA-binding NarL/FixJ family response regulator
MPIRILLADDHPEFRQSLRQLLGRHPDLEVIAEAASGWEAIDMANTHQPDVALLDVRMDGLTGIQAIPHIRHCSPQTAVVMLSIHRDHRYSTSSMEAGAQAYLLKDTTESALVSVIRRLCAA